MNTAVKGTVHIATIWVYLPKKRENFIGYCQKRKKEKEKKQQVVAKRKTLRRSQHNFYFWFAELYHNQMRGLAMTTDIPKCLEFLENTFTYFANIETTGRIKSL